MGQTDRSLKQRYSEHTSYIRQNTPQSTYAQHNLQHSHEFGHISDAMSLIQQVNKGKYMNTLEQYYKHEHTNTTRPS
jgi:DNA topoisomerase VI subunit A